MGSVKVPFALEGEAIATLTEDVCEAGAIAGLWVRVDGVVLAVKLAKALRTQAAQLPLRGARVRLVGVEKLDLRSGRQQLKARTLTVLSPGAGPIAAEVAPAAGLASWGAGDRVEFCGKKNCRQRGGEAAFQALREELAARGWSERVTVTWGSCLKRCKDGPAARCGTTVRSGLTPGAARSLCG